MTSSIEATRLRVIASSPLYFAESLPPVQLHYGGEDIIVPVSNGVLLANRLRARGDDGPTFELLLHPFGGHNLDRTISDPKTRDFLARYLGLTR